MKNARDWRDLSGVLAGKGSLMDAENVASIMNKVRRGAGNKGTATRGVTERSTF